VSVGQDEFKDALRCWASGVTIVTTNSAHFGIQGMTATAFCSVSVEPPQVLVCINESAGVLDGIGESQAFAVNILTQNQQDVSNRFAGTSSYAERFGSVVWEEGAQGSPLLTESLASLECKVVEKVRAGTHWIIVGQVEGVVVRSGKPLIYHKAGYGGVASE